MVQGLDALKRRFAAIPETVRAAVRAEMERQAEAVCDDMRKLARRRTGRMAGSIGWTWGEAPEGSMTLGQVRGGKRQGSGYGAMVITIYAGGKDAFWATFQEFGTKDMVANPFFFPVWRARRKKVRAGIARALRKALTT